MLIQRKKRIKVRRLSEELISPHSAREFYERYKKENKSSYYTKKYFLESDVTEYIETRYTRRRYLKSMAYYIEGMFIIEDYKSINHLKDIFIHNLLSKKLIDFGNTNNMDREFYIK